MSSTGVPLRLQGAVSPPTRNHQVEGVCIYIYVCMYVCIYIYAVGSITWPHFGHFKVNNLATVGSITWPPFLGPIKIGVFGDFMCTVFRGWCKISVFESCFWSKTRFPFFGGV